MFPSPVGESYFSMVTVYPCSSCSHNFRPLSGNLIFQWNDKRGAETVSNWVSVPCRGILFFNMSLHTSIARGHGEFPSPVGESYFSILSGAESHPFSPHSFPSPIGESYFSIKIGHPATWLRERFPSPIGESYFSIMEMHMSETARLVSVPYRGILFFNKI